jgi:bifunctional ADP-heptose synthase (sugar kinase/adenylyltransferase)
MNFDAVKDYRVLIVGDAIRDRYVFVKPLGKSMKDSVISVGYDREEEYLGGVWAAAGHLGKLCARVDVLHGQKVMVNTRFVEESGNRKLFTLHALQEEKPSPDVDIRAYDVVIVADFGHGTMTPDLIGRVSKEARFLAVNAQTNSSNYGFNLITKYPRADFAVVDELEARLAAQDRSSDIEDVIIKLGYRRIVVTLGSRGAVGFDGAFYREQARTQYALDSMGAGDAFLVVSAVFAKAMCSMKDVVSIGNAAGAAKVGVVGHRRPISREDLEVHGPGH